MANEEIEGIKGKKIGLIVAGVIIVTLILVGITDTMNSIDNSKNQQTFIVPVGIGEWTEVNINGHKFNCDVPEIGGIVRHDIQYLVVVNDIHNVPIKIPKEKGKFVDVGYSVQKLYFMLLPNQGVKHITIVVHRE